MSNFIKELNKAYKSVLTEQVPPYGEPAGGMPPAAPPMPAGPAPTGMGTSIPQEQPIETPATRSSSDAFLIGLVAKALLIDIDDDDRLKIIKYLKGLDEDSASAIEENLVNIINNYDYQHLDADINEVEISPKKARKVLKFLNSVMKEYVDTETGDDKKETKD